MSKSSTTVRDVFELPERDVDGPENWKAFQEKVSKEVKGIKSAALPDMAEKVAELFDIPIPNIFLTSWKKANGIQSLLDESRKAPETVMNAELGDHTINSQHRPHIEIRIQNKAVKKIEFTLKLVFNLKGFVLKIQNGMIRGMQTGSCEVRGKMEYQGLVIAEKKLAPITLPGMVSFDEIATKVQPASVEEKPATVAGKTAGLTAAGNEQPNKNIDEPAVTVAEAGTEENSSLKTSQSIEEAPDPKAASLEAKASDLGSGAVMLHELTGPEINQIPQVDTNAPSAGASGAPEVAAPEPDKSIASAPEVNELTNSEGDVIAAADTAEAAPAAERMTWEVGDDEQLDGNEQRENVEIGRESASEETPGDESPEDIISRMSRELADKQQSTNGADETNDRVKAAS